jgi:monovalent cation/proton antiporter MnhG/PhaG subunit
MNGWIVFLLFAAVLLVLLCSIGIAVMGDPYQRLQFPAPISGVAVPLIVAAVFIQTNDFQARAKAVLVMIILFFTNAVLTHATARAERLRTKGHWEVESDDVDIERVKS